MYTFRYRRRFCWKSFKVVGHHYDVSQDKMCLFFDDGSVREVSRWRECEVHLGTDWVLSKKKQMEKEAGQPVVLNLGGPHS